MKVTVQILNWDKYNKRTGGIKKPWWFSLSNTLVEDTDFFDFSHGEFKTWIYLLSQSSKQQKPEFLVNLDHAKNVSNISQKEFLSALDKLAAIKCVSVRDPNVIRTRSVQHTTGQDKTRQNNTIAQTSLSELVSQLYREFYPRKVGKTKGIAKLLADKSLDIDLLKTSLTNYKAYHDRERTEAKYIPHFSTWASSWRDWLDSDAGSSSISKADLFDFLPKDEVPT